MNVEDAAQYIESQPQLERFCTRCEQSKIIGFDTEFVSENRYRPELCLLQVASDQEIAVIDTLKVKDIRPFWKMLTEGEHITVAHAAREEFLFCYRGFGQRPKKLMDVQLAAGFVGLDYPASYSNLVSQVLGEYVSKGETRTDWKQRPLTDRQISYAVGDVVHLHDLYARLTKQMESLGRTEWYWNEIESWMDQLEKTEKDPQWHKVSGASRLNRRSLAILRELWFLRDAKAKEKNRSPKRIIPDDLLVELAKRGSARPSHFKSIRGFENRTARGISDQIATAIERGLSLKDSELPAKLEKSKSVNLGLVGQFLSTMMGVVCRNQHIAPTLVATVQEVREFAAWRMGQLKSKTPPDLAVGWRAEFIGDAIDQALAGKIALRVENPKSDHPLAIEELE